MVTQHSAGAKYNLGEIAAIYRTACDEGTPPTKEVARRTGATYTAAAKLVSRARGAGLLEPTTPGRSPVRNRKVVAIAEALDVDPDRLRDAVIAHADGNLRVQP